jgi:hypothetical protein
MAKWSDKQLNDAGRAIIPSLPPEILRNVPDVSKLTFNLDPKLKGTATAQAPWDQNVILIGDPEEFMRDPREYTYHELTHRAQGGLSAIGGDPSKLSTIFRPVDQDNPYGETLGPNSANHLMLERARGHNIQNQSIEETGGMMQELGAYEDAAGKDPAFKTAYDRQKSATQPYLDDFDEVARYGHVLTAKDADDAEADVRGKLGGTLPQFPSAKQPTVSLDASAAPKTQVAAVDKPVVKASQIFTSNSPDQDENDEEETAQLGAAQIFGSGGK